MPGARCTRVLKCTKKTHTSLQVQRRHSGIPRALPGDEFVLSPSTAN
ncbi:hypothetical protein SAMN05443247_02607 [Bradyrhizobium erythrophlei]|nr:hypothetical protein SAMN05443247_02607 [Bradyrhizobium erythrophlei]